MSGEWEKKQIFYPEKQVVKFRSLDKQEDAFTLELSNTMKCHEVERRVANQLGLIYPIEIGMTRIRLTPHNYQSNQPKYEPERWGNTSLLDMLGHNCEMFDILYYQVLDTPARQSALTMNIPFYHAARDELSVYNVESHSLRTVGDMLYKLKSKVQLSRPNAELRLLLVRSNSIQKVLEGEKYIGPRDIMIQVNHVNREEFKRKMKKVWKSARGKYFQDSDILFHHFERVDDWLNRGSSHFPGLCLEHCSNSWRRTSASNQQQEDKLMVVHSRYVPGPKLIEERQAEIVNPAKSLPIKDSSSTRFVWTIKNFSKLNSLEHYSDVFSVSCYEWRAMIFPKGNNVDHLSVYLNTADSTSSVYAEFSLTVVNQSHAKQTLRIENMGNSGLLSIADTQHEFSPRQSSWGVASLIPLSELNDPGKGYIINDTCIIEANVSVVRPIKKQKLGVPSKEKSSDNLIKNNALSGNLKENHDEVVPVFVKVEAPDEEMPNDVATIEPSKLLGITSSLLEYPLAGQLYEEPQNILDEKFEEIGGFSVLKTQSSLYKKTYITLLLAITRFSEISPSRIETWERKLKMAEKLEFNVKWHRQRFEVIKKVFYDDYQSMQAEKARFIQVEDELKKAREAISAMEIEKEMYLEKVNRYLFDGSL
ncbi:hypothetical protein C5167_036677 [Papaver somniferum]|uniref:MATH domain-containing protein n=1 Tax=Papaver somniferum TaxID=3469 RepID=A0A4Y7I8I5_PAPSO|nr:hypothetical protein C5167_036677 [Papaver somniferum]